jgi:hypothetical protein
MSTIACPYCGKSAELTTGDWVYPHRKDLSGLKFWVCWPCDAFVGCHQKGAPVGGKASDGTLPLGRLANAELRRAKSAAHAAFDPLWKSGRMSRREAYGWLASKLGIHADQCHIGMFDVHHCKAVIDVIRDCQGARV